MQHNTITIKNIPLGGGGPLVLIAGPCVIESAESCRGIAQRLKEICGELDLPLVFKASFDKANRSSVDSYRGPGLTEGLAILKSIADDFDLPVTTDIHEPAQAEAATGVLDMLQVPAFLCRQTDLLVAVGRTRLPVNIKKGQFMAPEDMRYAVEKVASTGNQSVCLTERGTTFGYRNLVVDMRALPVMRGLGVPVIMDGTHAVQSPGGGGGKTSGDRAMAPYLLRAAVAAGVDGLFIETHPNPDQACSDGPNMIPTEDLPPLLRLLQDIHATVRQHD
jgi:2-dehydro-3-deoxyphosphooctonate aldolase (KDO 8-P synthase)